MYVSTDTNPNYLGPAPIDQIAAQVLRSRGPSGPNDYVLRLAEALREIEGQDPHVFALEALVRRSLARAIAFPIELCEGSSLQ